MTLWFENAGRTMDMIASLKNLKEKFLRAESETQGYWVRLMTKSVTARAYTGENKRVDKKLPKTLDFEWNEESQALFDMGVIRAVDEQAKEWTKKYGPKTPSSKSLRCQKKDVDILFSIS